MITPSYSLTATERVLPRLALDFTTAILDSRVTFTRSGNTATVTNSSGAIVGVNADIPRFDFDPVTLACRGLLIEESRTNVLLDSLLDGTSLATQTVVVTAAARTLSFYGTGQIVLSGAASATVTGTGAYPTRTTLTFTPSAGALILTVTGTVQFAQLELGSFNTSFILTGAAAVTRNADVATMTGTNFSDWYNATEGGFVVSTIAATGVSVTQYVFSVSDGTNNNLIAVYRPNTKLLSSTIISSGAAQHDSSSTVTQENSTFAGNGIAIKASDSARAFKGNSAQSVASSTLPTVDRLQFGNRTDGLRPWNGHISKFAYYTLRLITAEVQAFSK
jgi:hypothetical protein